MRSAWLPNTSRIPAARSARGAARGAGLVLAAGREATPKRISSAEAMKVAASRSSEVRTPKNATIAPPAANPMTWASWKVVRDTAVATTYRSPARISG